MYTDFGTIVTAIITPFDTQGEVNHSELRRIARHLESHGSDSIVVMGTTGEAPTLTDDEKLACIATVVDEVGERMPVIAGTGTNDTAHSTWLTRAAVEAGATGILAVTPYYNRPPREGLLRHFAKMAKAAKDVPVMLYNIPARSAIGLEPELIAQLSEIDNIVALKQATPELDQLRQVRSLAPDLAVYAGDDVSLVPMLREGVLGVVSVASHIVGDRMKKVCQLFFDGQQEQALELGRELDDVYEVLSITSNPIPIKASMGLLGFEVGTPRLPLVDASAMQIERLRSMLERNEILSAHV